MADDSLLTELRARQNPTSWAEYVRDKNGTVNSDDRACVHQNVPPPLSTAPTLNSPWLDKFVASGTSTTSWEDVVDAARFTPLVSNMSALRRISLQEWWHEVETADDEGVVLVVDSVEDAWFHLHEELRANAVNLFNVYLPRGLWIQTRQWWYRNLEYAKTHILYPYFLCALPSRNKHVEAFVHDANQMSWLPLIWQALRLREAYLSKNVTLASPPPTRASLNPPHTLTFFPVAGESAVRQNARKEALARVLGHRGFIGDVACAPSALYWDPPKTIAL